MHCDVATFMTSNCEQTLGHTPYMHATLAIYKLFEANIKQVKLLKLSLLKK